MTSQGSAHGRFTRAIQAELFQAELALREMRDPSLLIPVDYLELLADVRPDKFDRAAVRWHGRLELETPLSRSPSRSSPWPRWALSAWPARRNRRAAQTVLRRVRPTLLPRVLERGRAHRTGSPSQQSASKRPRARTRESDVKLLQSVIGARPQER